MADPTVTPPVPTATSVAVTKAASNGADTSEHRLADFVAKLAAVVMLLGTIAACLPASVGTNHWAGLAIAVLGGAMKVVVALGYGKQRSDLKSALLDAAVALAPQAVPEVKALESLVPDAIVPTPTPPAAPVAPAGVPTPSAT